jgi:hypothetical protein
VDAAVAVIGAVTKIARWATAARGENEAEALLA